MTRRLVALAGALAIALLAADSAAACSCAEPVAPRAARDSVDGAIVGRLLAVREVNPPEEGDPIDPGRPADFVYRVGRVYDRGPRLHRGLRIKVRSPRETNMCGLPDTRRRLYGLFLERRDGRWTSGLCSVRTPREMRRAYEGEGSAAASSTTGMRRGARSRYCTQPG